MAKIVINDCFGGFSLSDDGYAHYLTLKGIEFETRLSKFRFRAYDKDFFNKGHLGEDNHWLSCRDIERDDQLLIQTVEELGAKANGWAASLKIVEIPDDVEWQIEEYDGNEHIAEKHRTWC